MRSLQRIPLSDRRSPTPRAELEPVADALHAVATLRLVVLLVYFSQELQSNVLGLRRQSAKPVTVGSEPDRYRREFGDYYSRQGHRDEETHTQIMVWRGSTRRLGGNIL